MHYKLEYQLFVIVSKKQVQLKVIVAVLVSFIAFCLYGCLLISSFLHLQLWFHIDAILYSLTS